MITPACCNMLAQYNAWQNSQLIEMLTPVSEAELLAERGAFFGSIQGTINHAEMVLWCRRA